MDNRKKTLLRVGTVMAVLLIAIVGYYVSNSYFYVTTDDAKVTADLAKITAQITGRLVSSELEEGMVVAKDQIVARQEVPNLTDTALEQSLLRAPIDGIVVKKQGQVGEVVTVGQTLGMVIDPKQIYILANIEETKLGKVHEGQKVDVTIDEFGSKKWKGTVTQIGEAANSTFALLSSSGSGAFTKVVQKVPVHIVIDTGTLQLRPGTNAIVKIHIR